MTKNANELSGNKGEWSELYVLFKVLGDGCIWGADGDLNRNGKIYTANRVFRLENEPDSKRELVFTRVPDDKVVEIEANGKYLATVQFESVQAAYDYLLGEIKRGKGSFPIPKSLEFARSIGCTSIKASCEDKADIKIEIHEPETGMDLVQGFSIKSKLGDPSTLVNASKATNCVYRLVGPVTSALVSKANAVFGGKSKTKVRDGLSILRLAGVELQFIDTFKPIFHNNLVLIDSNMPTIVGELLKIYYIDGISDMAVIIKEMTKRNPLGYDDCTNYPYYEQKIKKLLVSYALGMKSASRWNGKEEANGGYIVVKEDGDVVCIHIFDRMTFEDYLVKNTKTDTASTTRHQFARIYKEGEEYKINLNLQIRFDE